MIEELRKFWPFSEVEMNGKRYRLPPDVTRILIAEFQQGNKKEGEKESKKGERAYEKLVKANIGFLYNWISFFSRSGLSAADLLQEALLGFIDGLHSYDEAKNGGANPIYYVRWRVFSFLGKAAANSRVIRVPQVVDRAGHKVRRLKGELFLKYGREPTDEEVANALGGESAMLKVQTASIAMFSLDEERPGCKGSDGHSLIPAESNLSPELLMLGREYLNDLVCERKRIFQLVANADTAKWMRKEMNKQIFFLRYGRDDTRVRSTELVASMLGCTRQNVERILDKWWEEYLMSKRPQLDDSKLLRFNVTVSCIEETLAVAA